MSHVDDYRKFHSAIKRFCRLTCNLAYRLEPSQDGKFIRELELIQAELETLAAPKDYGRLADLSYRLHQLGRDIKHQLTRSAD